MTDSKITRVALVSDQAIYLRGLTSLLMTIGEFQLVGEARSAEDALQLCQITEPELVFIDLQAAHDQGRDILQQIHARWPLIKVALLLNGQEEGHAQDEFPEMPVYCFSRDLSEEEFRAALHQVRDDTFTPVSGGFQHQAEEETFHETTIFSNGRSRQDPFRDGEVLTRELVMAGKIQADILPEEVPALPGWDISASLEPARETSGDFYDFIPLSPHKMGLVVADVTDKGMGAALFMVLTSTLIRTYSARYPTLPAVVLSAVSERILTDTRGGMFVTTLFGVLETHTGQFVYANAGHPPGYLIRTQRGKESITALRPTGMAVGVTEEARWKQKVIKMSPGDMLVLYTDGITEAESPQGGFFGEDRLIDAVFSKPHGSAREVRDALLDAVRRFSGNGGYQDDITLMVVRRTD